MKQVFLEIDLNFEGLASLVFDSETGSLEWHSENQAIRRLMNLLLSAEDWSPEQGDRVLSLYHKAENLKIGKVSLRYPPQGWQAETEQARANSALGVCF